MNLMKYDIFLESRIGYDDDIYSFYEELVFMRQHINSKSTVTDYLKSLSDHFIGEGAFNEIKTHYNKLQKAFSNCDIDYVKDRLVDLFDEYAGVITKCSFAVGHYQYFDIHSTNQYKYKSFYFGYGKELIPKIIEEIIYPTLFVSPRLQYGRKSVRITDFSKEVKSPEYNCYNFDINKAINDYNYDFKDIDPITINSLKHYSVTNVIQSFRPFIYVSFDNNTRNGPTINMKNLESEIDEVLKSILPEIDYEDVLYEGSRGNRRFDDDMEVYDYSFKILLNVR